MDALDPRHGERAGYLAHHRDKETPCEPCQLAHSRYCKRYELRKVEGYEPLIDAGKATAHVRELKQDGMTQAQIARAAGVTNATVHRVTHGQAKISADVARRLLDVARDVEPTAGKVPIVGTQRRVQALMCLGWSMFEIADRAGLERRCLVTVAGAHRRNDFVLYTTYTGVKRVFEELSMTPRTTTNRYEQSGITRTKRQAVQRGYAPPLAWDEGTIDDPDEKPHMGRQPYYNEQDSFDHAVVERIMSGDFGVYATRAERREIVRRWMAKGLALKDLERETGWRTHRYLTERAA